jgi:hypothetical protein
LATLLSELPLAPTSLLPSRKLVWEAIDESTARAILRDGDIEVSGIFHFDAVGRITKFETKDRYRIVKGKAEPCRWTVGYRDYVEFSNVMMPMWVRAAWEKDGRSFNYADMKFTYIKVDPSPILG